VKTLTLRSALIILLLAFQFNLMALENNCGVDIARYKSYSIPYDGNTYYTFSIFNTNNVDTRGMKYTWLIGDSVYTEINPVVAFPKDTLDTVKLTIITKDSMSCNLAASYFFYGYHPADECWAIGRVYDYHDLTGYNYIIRPETLIPSMLNNLEEWIDIKSVVSNYPLRDRMLIKFGYKPLAPNDPYGFLPADITCIEELKDTCEVSISCAPCKEYTMPVSNPQLIPYYILANFGFGTDILDCQWSFGKKSTNIYNSILHYFIGENDYEVCVTATHRGGCISSDCDTIHAEFHKISELCDTFNYFDPVTDTINCTAMFGFTVSDTLPLTYFFKDYSKGNIVSRNWDFGDGSYSNEQNPVHAYADTISNYDFGKIDSVVFNSNPDSVYENFVKSSSHTVSLTVVNKKQNVSKLTKVIYESNYCISSGPIIFSVDSISPLNYRFGSYCDDDNGESDHWDFGDGTVTTGCSPEHTYAKAGHYLVRLTNYFNFDLQREYTYSLNVTGTTLVENYITNQKEIEIYPNPVINTIYFEGLESDASNISILSIDGKNLKQINGFGIKQMDINDLPAGVYIIRIVKKDCLISRKLIKQER